jgi:hypothetical protein
MAFEKLPATIQNGLSAASTFLTRPRTFYPAIHRTAQSISDAASSIWTKTPKWIQELSSNLWKGLSKQRSMTNVPTVQEVVAPTLVSGRPKEMLAQAGQHLRNASRWPAPQKAELWRQMKEKIMDSNSDWVAMPMRGPKGEFIFTGEFPGVHGLVIEANGTMRVIGREVGLINANVVDRTATVVLIMQNPSFPNPSGWTAPLQGTNKSPQGAEQ